MRLLDRYLLRELFIWLGFVLGGLLICYIAFDIFGSLNQFQEKHLEFHDVLDLYEVKIPGILVFILPVVLLIALLFALTSHARHNELTAIRAAGISLWRICAPYLAVGFLLSLTVFTLNEMFVPDTEAKVAQIMERRSQKVAADPDIVDQLGFVNARDGRNWLIGQYNFKTDVMLNPHVAWREGDFVYELMARRAERIDGVWTFFGATAFTSNDIANLESFVADLRHSGQTNKVSQYLMSELSDETQFYWQTYKSGPNPDLQRALAADLDRLIRRGPLYDREWFAGIKLSPDTESLAEQKPRGTRMLELNRMLLLDAYPRDLSRNQFDTVTLWRGEKASNYQRVPFLNTNLLTMKQFAEAPQDFANEIKFNSRFAKARAKYPDVPLRELLEYKKLHPDLDTKYRYWLETQLYGRLALPWSCLVVVLIAIPFGAASGRRNIFMGVAGSIIICFAYFILFQIGLAMGSGGVIPAWVAAWLPNAVFGLAGFVLMLRVR